MQSRTSSYTYNGLGLVESIDGPRMDVNDVTTFTYDPANSNLTQVTNALGHVTRITSYDPSGRPLVLVDPNGLPITLTYDARGRLISRTANSKTTSFGYHNVGNLTSVTSPTGLVLTYTYDDTRRLIGIRDNLGNQVAYTLDSAGNIIRQDLYDPLDVLTGTQTRTYDELSRLISYTGGASQFNTYAYDKNGNNVSVIDGQAHEATNTFDGLNNLVSQTDAASGVVQIQYDALDQIKSVTDQNLNTTGYTWSALGNLLAIQSPDTGTTTFTYDEAGNVITKTDAKGVIITYTYDALNRMTGIQYPDTSLNITLTYDQGTNGIGRLTGVTVGANQVTSYRYDSGGNLTGVTTVVDGLVSTTGFLYNDSDQLIQITYPSGHLVDYLRNVLGNITEVQLTVNGITQTVVNNVTYEPFGPVFSMTYGNGIVRSLAYDLDYRLVNQNNPFQDLDYVYDAADNLLNITNTFASIEDRAYTYDLLNRLETRSSEFVQQS